MNTHTVNLFGKYNFFKYKERDLRDLENFQKQFEILVCVWFHWKEHTMKKHARNIPIISITKRECNGFFGDENNIRLVVYHMSFSSLSFFVCWKSLAQYGKEDNLRGQRLISLGTDLMVTGSLLGIRKYFTRIYGTKYYKWD